MPRFPSAFKMFKTLIYGKVQKVLTNYWLVFKIPLYILLIINWYCDLKFRILKTISNWYIPINHKNGYCGMLAKFIK